MTAPVPEETNAAFDLDEAPPGEHASELSDSDDSTDAAGAQQENAQHENAESSLDQPSQ